MLPYTATTWAGGIQRIVSRGSNSLNDGLLSLGLE